MTKTWRKRKKQQLAYGAARRAAFVAKGLRSDGKPRIGRKPCGCLFGSCLKCASTDNALIVKPAKVTAMYAYYQAGNSFEAVARKFNRSRKTVSQLFKRRGLPTRELKAKPRLGWGVLIPFPKKAEIDAMIDALPRLKVPAEVMVHWRKWNLKERRQFIKRLRQKFPSGRPCGKFSSNVQPFEYGTPRAHAIADRMNRGCNSRTKVIRLLPSSEGVIYKGQLFFWDGNDSYVQSMAWNTGAGPVRPVLKQIIYRQKIGPIPDGMTVVQKDGNKNNFLPKNFALRSRADCMHQNSIQRLPLKRREEVWDRSARSHIATSTRLSRAQVSVLLQSFQQPQQRPVMAELLRKK